MLPLHYVYPNRLLPLTALVQGPIDLHDLVDPTRTLAMLQREDLVVLPMKVIRQVRYLLAEPF